MKSSSRSSSAGGRPCARSRRAGGVPATILLIWPEPPQAAGGGTFLHDVLTEAGAENVLADRPGWPLVSPEYLAATPVDVLIVPESEGNREVYDRALRDGVLSRGAAKRARIIRVDESALTRPGPRVFEAMEGLARALVAELPGMRSSGMASRSSLVLFGSLALAAAILHRPGGRRRLPLDSRPSERAGGARGNGPHGRFAAPAPRVCSRPSSGRRWRSRARRCRRSCEPLADPFLLGTSGGAAAGAALASMAGVSPFLSPGAAFAGAAASSLGVVLLARRGGRLDLNRLLLAGLIANAFFSAVLLGIFSVASAQTARTMLFWMMGSLADATPARLAALIPYALAGAIAILASAGTPQPLRRR